ncbi:GTP cyclohydrolase II [Paracoccus sp. 1_MG-2023]|uniref:GTP cyclohydrolase II n=1 Tax=unclassified Paracoccus (in: a-proteobacteria) TaxID=2688777 RepID=UPI001C0814D4|nr:MULTISPECIES: GTP cyclohydrolase II [unclassified Paracoccus (in: a-proteobacteria)]MBU2958466.1 GTP cyclohydrolase II [Paracoccus sp. C2R09]MDO6668549.1 GTP cyclohydrolase II [Paracoccus sp. 1_MG-2023]
MRIFPTPYPQSQPIAAVSDPLALRAAERVARTVGDLRLGLPVVLAGDDGAAMVVAVETLTKERLDALRDEGMELVLTARRAEALHHPVDTDVARFPVSRDVRLSWLQAMADPTRSMAGPAALPRAPKNVTGSIQRAAIMLAKSAELVPAALIVPGPDVMATALRHNLSILSADEALAQAGLPNRPRAVSNARVPMAAAAAGRLHVFRPDTHGPEHYAIQVGEPDPSRPVLVRLHSACFTGDVLGSLKCDCGPQLQAAIAAMNEAGSGILLYLNQEGRGIGLANKMRAYGLQDQGLDTVEANHRLGFEDDERDFRVGASLLRELGIGQVRLLTNNPAKIRRLESEGIVVAERVRLMVGRGPDNTRYLDTKAAKSGHLFA